MHKLRGLSGLCAIAAMSVGALMVPAANATITYTGAALGDLIPYDPGPGATSVFNGTSWILTSPDNVSGSGQFNDTAEILVTNGYLGASLGTLNSLLAAGAAGQVSFNLSQVDVATSNQSQTYAYWDVFLSNPSNPTQTIEWNAYGDNFLGANPFNQGVPGNSSVDASCSSAGTCVFGPWSPSVTSTYGTWNVMSVSIGVGGWNLGPASQEIDSVTVPGISTAVPEPASLVLLAAGLAGLGLIRRRTGGHFNPSIWTPPVCQAITQ